MSGLREELKRRNVIRVAVAYLITGWLVLQVADLVLENISAPDWIMQVFMLAVGLGLLPVVIFSWAYEITPEGVKREQEVDRCQSITGGTGRLQRQTNVSERLSMIKSFSPGLSLFSNSVGLM